MRPLRSDTQYTRTSDIPVNSLVTRLNSTGLTDQADATQPRLLSRRRFSFTTDPQLPAPRVIVPVANPFPRYPVTSPPWSSLTVVRERFFRALSVSPCFSPMAVRGAPHDYHFTATISLLRSAPCHLLIFSGIPHGCPVDMPRHTRLERKSNGPEALEEPAEKGGNKNAQHALA